MPDSLFQPHHVCAAPADIAGNHGLGRYVFLPGSDNRAREIAGHFRNVRVLESPRRHNLYLGTLERNGQPIDVASVSSGMGCPSLDIIAQELFKLGARRFLRVGTAGSLQAGQVRLGDLVVATAAVRDEGTSKLYVPPEFPAVASIEFVSAAGKAARALGLDHRAHLGIIHAKDSLFAREFGEGPMAPENERYMAILKKAGVVASEMESSHLFVLASILSRQLADDNEKTAYSRVLAGSILAIIGEEGPFAPGDTVAQVTQEAISLALETVRVLAATEEGLDRPDSAE